jgi:hypothetical protein
MIKFTKILMIIQIVFCMSVASLFLKPVVVATKHEIGLNQVAESVTDTQHSKLEA